MAWNLSEEVTALPPISLPAHKRAIGHVQVAWFEDEPGKAVIVCEGGTQDDRLLAEILTRHELAMAGIRQASFSDEDGFHKTAAWPDIMAKAKRLIQSGNVTLLRNSYNTVAAHVVGDHGEYQVEISRDDPQSRAITQWTCECPWDQYAFNRTRQWKKYEARPCAHVLAAYWSSLAAPLEEDQAPPGTPAPLGPQGVPPSGTPVEQPPGGGPGGPPPPGGGIATPDGQWSPAPPGGPQPGLIGPQTPTPEDMGQMTIPGVAPPPFAPPAGNGLIPPNPMDPAALALPVSVPGGRPGPYPANPVQQPGTFSHVFRVGSTQEKSFPEGATIRLNEATYGQSEGRQGAYDAGQWMEVPRNSKGEVVYQDPTTGWVEVTFPLKGGPMSSYHVRCFIEPEKLTPLEGYSPFQNPRSSAYETDPSGKRVWNYQKSLDQNLPGWNPQTQGTGDFDSFERAVRGVIRQTQLGNQDENAVFEVVMEMMSGRPPGQVNKDEIYKALNNAVQYLGQGGSKPAGEGNPSVYKPGISDAPRLVAPETMGFQELPPGLEEKIPGWGSFPGFVGDPHYPARVRWTNVSDPD